MPDIKKTSWPAIIITVVMLAVAGYAVFAIVSKGPPGKENKEGEKEKDGQNAGSEQGGGGEKEGVINIAPDELASHTYPEIAADMLQKIILDKSIDKHMQILKDCNEDELNQQLSNDELRLCFWINVYNGYTQYFLKKDPTLYKEDRNEFFKKEQIQIAGYDLAMNDIEHGALRRGATIWSKGKVRIPFRNDFVNKFKLSAVDYRIHFALNCGAKSCPPVSVYLPGKTNGQLDKASCSYLKNECVYKKEENKIMLPALMTWFSDDFGSRKDKLVIVSACNVIPADVQPDIEYKDYDWTMMVKNYQQF